VPATVAANVTRWTKPANAGDIAFAVAAYNEAGTSAPSAPFADAPPIAATTFTAVATAYNVVSLAWDGNSTNNSIEISRNGVVIKTLPGMAKSFVDTTVAAQQNYTYTLKFANTKGAVEVSQSVTTPITPMTAPTNLTATYNNNNPASIRVRWTDSASNETAYQVEVSTDGGVTFSALTNVPRTGAQIAATGATITLTPNVVALPGKTYVFRVTAFNGTNTPAATTSTPVITAPAASTVPVAAPGVLGGQVTLIWSNPSSSITRWTLQRRLGNAGYRNVNNPLVTNTGAAYTFTDSGLTPGGIYTYRITAVNAQGTSPVATSNTVTAR
jgi:titin